MPRVENLKVKRKETSIHVSVVEEIVKCLLFVI